MLSSRDTGRAFEAYLVLYAKVTRRNPVVWVFEVLYWVSRSSRDLHCNHVVQIR